MTELQNRYQEIKKSLGAEVTLVTVSKTHPAEKIAELYEAGARIFGENRVQELIPKAEALPKDIEWHLIGHLQTNKVKQVLPYVHTIESVDSEKLLLEISKECVKAEKAIKVYLQVKIAKEESKFGLTLMETLEILQKSKTNCYPAVKITGLMGMATFTDDANQVQEEFTTLADFYHKHQQEFGLTKLSMGMSDDYQIAVKCGSNSVRIGSAIFGKRENV